MLKSFLFIKKQRLSKFYLPYHLLTSNKASYKSNKDCQFYTNCERKILHLRHICFFEKNFSFFVAFPTIFSKHNLNFAFILINYSFLHFFFFGTRSKKRNGKVPFRLLNCRTDLFKKSANYLFFSLFLGKSERHKLYKLLACDLSYCRLVYK